MTPRPGTPVSSVHFDVLDGLRGTVFLIMLKHFSAIVIPETTAERIYHGVTDVGMMGIDIFFVVSGFLITGILVDAKGGPNYFKSFYTRRALRIFPLYYGFLIVWFVILPKACPCPRETFTISFWQDVLYWTYSTNIGVAVQGWSAMAPHTLHLWSVAVEEQFYLFWPAVVFFSTSAQLRRVAIGCLIAVPLLRLGFVLSGVSEFGGYLLTPFRMDSLALGALLALLAREAEGLQRFRGWAVPVVFLTLGGCLAIYAVTGHFHPRQQIAQTLGLTLSTWHAGALVILALTAAPGSWLRKCLTNKPIVAIGGWSYAIYVLHYPLAPLLKQLGLLQPQSFAPYFSSRLGADMAYVGLMMALSIFAGFVSWHAYEKHFLKLKRFFPYAQRREVRRAEVRERLVA